MNRLESIFSRTALYRWPFLGAVVLHGLLILLYSISSFIRHNTQQERSAIQFPVVTAVSFAQLPKMQKQGILPRPQPTVARGHSSKELVKQAAVPVASAAHHPVAHEVAARASVVKRADVKQKRFARLQEQLVQRQLLADQQQLQLQAKAAEAQSAETQSVIAHYKSAILQAIGQNWIVPAGVKRNLSSVYQIRLAPGGFILSVVLVHSSGDAVLDRSAETAIYKAEPLPVPKEAEWFDNFRELRLTVSPRTVLEVSDSEGIG